MNLEQYKLISARRISFNALVWQTPTLASAAQAFLLSASVNLTRGITPVVLSLFSMFVGVAALQLMLKHRFYEVADSELLRKFEASQPLKEGYSVVHGPLDPAPPATRLWDCGWVFLVNQRASRIWVIVLCGFILLGFFAACRAAVRFALQTPN